MFDSPFWTRDIAMGYTNLDRLEDLGVIIIAIIVFVIAINLFAMTRGGK